MAKQKLRPSWMTDNKERFNETPWMLVRQRMYRGQYSSELWTAVIKRTQMDCTKEYARWMTKQWEGNPVGDDADRWDGGDVYCRVVLQGELYQVLGETPTLEQQEEWMELRAAAMAHPDPFEAMGFV